MMSVVLTVGGVAQLGACNTPLAREFRTVAGQGIQSGVTTIANSVLDGIFAIVSPDATTNDSQ